MPPASAGRQRTYGRDDGDGEEEALAQAPVLLVLVVVQDRDPVLVGPENVRQELLQLRSWKKIFL